MAEKDRTGRVIARSRKCFSQALVSDERLVSLVRAGEASAFEALYDRHVAALLSYCFFMLGSREDAEDAVQSTFASAHRALLRDERHVEPRPWLFAIARNTCIGMLRKRRPQEGEGLVELAGEDLLAKVERRESLRELLAGLLQLPERHRSALLLAELHGHSQREIGQLLGVPAETVKSYIFQARTALASERAARETACGEIRAQLASARGAALLRGRLRRHLRSCADCRLYADHISSRRRALGALLPLLPTLALRRRVLDATAGQAAGPGLCAGGVGAGATLSGAIELGGAGAKTLVAKLLIGAGLAAGAGAGTLALGAASPAPAARVPASMHLAESRQALRTAGAGSPPSPAYSGRPTAGGSTAGGSTAQSAPPGGAPAPSGAGRNRPVAKGGTSGTDRATSTGTTDAGKGAAVRGAAGEGHGGQGVGSAGEHGKAKGQGEAHGNSAAAHAGTSGNGKAAEHAHGQGKGTPPGHGANGHAMAGKTGQGEARSEADREGRGQSASAPGHAQSSSPGHANAGPQVSGAPAAREEPGKSGEADGQGRSAAPPAEATPAGPEPDEAEAAAHEPPEHGHAGAAQEPPGQAKS